MHPVALLALPVTGYAASRVTGALALRASDRVTAATRLRRANRVLQAAAGLAGLYAVTDSRLDDAVAAATPGPDAAGVLTALAATVLAGGVLPALAVHLGTRPAWSAVTGNPPDYHGTLKRYAAGVAVLTAPAFVVVAAWLASPPGLTGVAVIALAVLIVLAVLPPVAALLGPVRKPTDSEAAVIPDAARGLHVRVVDTGDTPVANALAAGLLPGARYVFATDALFDTLDADATAAVLAHEAGHHHRGHVLARFAATGLALTPVLLAATGVLHGLPLAAAASIILLVAVGPAVRWTEYDADAYAARAVSPHAMERALATLADRGLLPADRPRIVDAVSLHPGVDDRITRLHDPNRF